MGVNGWQPWFSLQCAMEVEVAVESVKEAALQVSLS